MSECTRNLLLISEVAYNHAADGTFYEVGLYNGQHLPIVPNRFNYSLTITISNGKRCFFLKNGGHRFFFWGHWYPCSGLLVMFALGFKARVDLWFTWFLRLTFCADFLMASIVAGRVRCLLFFSGGRMQGVERVTSRSRSRFLNTIYYSYNETFTVL